MNVLITGGAGYIGSELTRVLAANSAINKVVVYDNLSRSNYNLFTGTAISNGNKVKFVEGDLLDSRKLRTVLEGIDAVVHCAAKVSTPFADQNPHLFEQVNHWGTAELVYAIEASSVKRLIYLSSVSVYGASSEEVTVATPTNPRTFYGISKMRGEEHVARLFEQVTTSIVRCGNVYGYSPGMRYDAVVNQFMFNAHFKGRITIHGDGNQHRSFIHVERVSSVLANLCLKSDTSSTFNLVDRVMSINDLADLLKDLYPELEMVFVNQHMKLREIKVSRDPIVDALSSGELRPMAEDLAEFRSRFAF